MYAPRGLLPSVALPLHIAKAEERLRTVILVKVSVQFSLLFGEYSFNCRRLFQGRLMANV